MYPFVALNRKTLDDIIGIQEYREFYLQSDTPPILDCDADYTKFDRIYLWYEMFNMFDDNVPAKAPAEELMHGYVLADDPNGTGMWLFLKE